MMASCRLVRVAPDCGVCGGALLGFRRRSGRATAVSRVGCWLPVIVGVALQAGCMSSATSITALQAQNRALADQNKAQSTRFENLQVHSRNLESRLARAEEDLATMGEQLTLKQRQLATYEQERDLLKNQVPALAGPRVPMPAGLGRRLVEISRQYPSLQFDENTGVSKLDTDILFDTGSAELKAGADQVLRELAQVLASPEARDLRIMVAGHTDDRPVARKPARDKFANNFELSTDRALVVAEMLKRFGVDEQRMAVAGFGASQPVSPNLTSQDRQKNRRVELFVMAPSVPVIGWTETTPTLY